jgi:hypothetical protein
MITISSFRPWIVLVLAVLQYAVSSIVFGVADFETLSADGPIPAPQDLATPAGYVFAIWFVIYSGSVAYGIHQALPSQRHNELYGRVGWLTAGCFAACIAWIIFARFGPAWVTIPLIWIMFACIASAFLIAVRHGVKAGLERWVTLPLLSIYAGWLTAASVLNVTNILPEYGISILGLTGVPLAAFSLVAATALAIAICTLSRGYLGYVATLAWALSAIVASVFLDGKPVNVAIFAGCALAGLLGYAVALKFRTSDRKAPAAATL